MSIFLENVLLPDGNRKNISIAGSRIESIGKEYNNQTDKIDCSNLMIFPSLINAHTHSAMTLLRGYGEDLPLEIWLTEKIWPKESKYIEEDFYWGYRLAFLEMIKSGTTYFSDMYFQPNIAIEAANEIGIKGNINFVFIDGMDPENGKKIAKECESYFNSIKNLPPGIEIGIAPHSIYTVHPKTLSWISSFANERNLRLHIHLSETEKELNDSISSFGLRPAFHLEKLGILNSKTILAHGLWLDNDELKLVKDSRTAIVHNPVSNMKLSSGPALNLDLISRLDIPLLLGTDGVSSNNNLDLIEEMKFAALLQKQSTGDPTMGPADLIYNMATKNGADWFNLESGDIKEGNIADLIFLSTETPHIVPISDPVGSLVYSANGNDVIHTMCSGKFVMRDRIVQNQDNIVKNSSLSANRILEL